MFVFFFFIKNNFKKENSPIIYPASFRYRHAAVLFSSFYLPSLFRACWYSEGSGLSIAIDVLCVLASELNIAGQGREHRNFEHFTSVSAFQSLNKEQYEHISPSCCRSQSACTLQLTAKLEMRFGGRAGESCPSPPPVVPPGYEEGTGTCTCIPVSLSVKISEDCSLQA